MRAWVCNIELLAGILLLHATAMAATFTVTRTDDPAPNGCNVGDCSLREAVLAANSLSGIDNVQLAAATYSVNATIEITGELSVIGVDAAQTHIVAAGELDPLFVGALGFFQARDRT